MTTMAFTKGNNTRTACTYTLKNTHYILLAIAILLSQQGVIVNVECLTVAVFGGSGFIGRRVSQTLVDAGCDVISISRSGKPPSYYCNKDVNGNDSNSQNWSDLVTWVSHDMRTDMDMDTTTSTTMNITTSKDPSYNLPKIDAAISCIGNVQPDPEWLKSSFFGLAFNNERLYYENGNLNENAIQMAKAAGAKRFIYISVSYEVAKMLEGPIAGYINGKRHAEHAAYTLFGKEDENAAIVLGPSFVYGGKRLSKFGNFYRSFVESFVAKAYVGGNESLRNLSSAPMEDWVEKTLFSPPVKVDVVARVASAAALGFVKRDMVGERRQGFFDTKGKPVLYDDLVFVDGTKELERVDEIMKPQLLQWADENTREREPTSRINDSHGSDDGKEPIFEGALIGKQPFLFPFPVAAFFGTMFYFISSGQFYPSNL